MHPTWSSRRCLCSLLLETILKLLHYLQKRTITIRFVLADIAGCSKAKSVLTGGKEHAGGNTTRAPLGLSCSLFAIREHIPRRISGSHGWFQTQGNFPWLDTCLRSLFAGSRRRQPAVNSVSGQVCCPREHSRKGSEHRIGAVCSSDDPLLGPFYGLCHCANLYQCH